MSYRRKNKYHYKEEKRSQIVFNKDPLSLTHPTQIDIINESLLENVLRSAGRLKENKLEAQQREYVLQDLDQICQEWVIASARKHNHPEEFVSNSKVRLFAYGSYKLDVHSLGDDVDLLCVGPNFLTRNMFFDELGPILQSNSCVKHFYSVPASYVPVMSFEYNGIDIDLVYAQLQIELLDDEWNINDDRNLRNLDFPSILSINGVRLAHKTLELVPNKIVFRLSLRAIRYWAKQRGIYSNKLGYLGGVSWAILTARVCQLYPYANASQIVQNFFLFYHIWNFGTPLKAITLCNIVHHEEMPSIKVWDPNDQSAKYELMHIITPAFPAMNSTHNVSISTFEVLKKEIARSFHLLSRAKRSIDGDKWKELFCRNTFFIDHKNYIFVKACAPKRNLTEWSGFIESKIRSLVTGLEHYPDVKVTPFCRAIKLKLKQEEIDECTHSDVLDQIKRKKKQRLLLQKQKLLELKRKKLDRMRFEKLRADFHNKVKAEKEALKDKEDKEDKENKDDDVQIIEIKTENTKSTDNEQTKDAEKDDDDMISNGIGINDDGHKEIKKDKMCVEEDENEVMIISNLSVPIETTDNKSASKSPSLSSNGSASTPSVTSSTMVQQSSSASNPYIYVAPELQRKYTFKGRNRRGRYGRHYNRTYTASSAAAKKDEVKSNDEVKNDDEVIVSNPHAFVVGKGQIACCESFNNNILMEKASKSDYECKAFVIGLKVMKKVLQIDTLSDGQQIEQTQRFDFSRSVLSFLVGLGHQFTSSHVIIELINCNRVPHYLFSDNDYKRPNKKDIIQHQIAMEKLHVLWKSKSCTATLEKEQQKALSSPSTSVSFDKDDILMNDDSMEEAMPGLNITQSVDINIGIKRKMNDINVDENENVKRRKLMTEINEKDINYLNPYFEGIEWDNKYDNSPTFEYALKLYKKSQTFTSWHSVEHDLTATATHIYNTCNDESWKRKLKKVLSVKKYGWNGEKYLMSLNKKLMFDLAHDIAYNYIEHKNEKKRKRKTKILSNGIVEK